MSRNRQVDQLRRSIAVEAARLISESGQRDFQAAKRKAAQRLGAGDDTALPTNQEIDAALREHQSLFQPGHATLLQDLRSAAAEAMHFFAQFQPRLVGAVLDGTADAHSAISLHVFAESSTDIIVFLLEQGVDYEEGSRVLRYSANEQHEVPVFRFSADDRVFDLSVFAIDDLRQAPLDRVTGQVMRRMARNGVRELIDNAT